MVVGDVDDAERQQLSIPLGLPQHPEELMPRSFTAIHQETQSGDWFSCHPGRRLDDSE